MIVYLGSEPKGWLGAEILRFTLQKGTKEPIQFKELKNLSLDLPLLPKPGSSFNRWFIPYFEKYQGKVLYLDPSIVALGDIQEIFKLDMNGKGALAREVEKPSNTEGYHSGVMLMDCAKLTHWDPESWAKLSHYDSNFYSKTMWALPEAPNHADMGPLPARWHQLDEAHPDTKLIHYYNPSLKPWRTPNHPQKIFFLKALKQAIEEEYIPLETLLLEIQLGHIYPQIIQDSQA